MSINLSLFCCFAEILEIRKNGERNYGHSSSVSIGIDNVSIVHLPIANHVSCASSRQRKSGNQNVCFCVVLRCRELNFTKECPRNDYSCNCIDFLSFSEPPYDENATETRLCGQSNVFISKTRVVVIKYVYQASRYNVFNLTYATERELHL